MLKKILTSFIFYLFISACFANDLVEKFTTPSESHKPWVFWYWINGNITKEGIHADLKSMSEAGLGGVLLMHINEHGSIPAGPVRFLSDEYNNLLSYTFGLAEQFDLQVNLYNSEGWSVAGGPWITPDLGMKELSWSELNIIDASDSIQFPAPHSPLNYYEDIATLAFPTPAEFRGPSAETVIAEIEVSGQSNKPYTVSKMNPRAAADGDWNTAVSPRKDPETGEIFVKFDFHQDYTFQNAFVKFAAYGMMGRNYLLVSDDDIHYREVAFSKRGQIYDDISCFQFEPVTARHAKVVFKPTDNQLLYTAMPKVEVEVREVSFDNKPKIDNWCQKAAHSFPFFSEDAERLSFRTSYDKNSSISLDSVIDISEHLSDSGQLNWTPPSDNWTVIRFGMSSTEAINRPASAGGEGLEVDKMSTDSLDLHFKHYLSTAKALAGKSFGKSFVSTHADSWEVGRQNWTQGFEHAFEDKRGYSPLKYLPATLGYVIDNPKQSERFLWDMRKTIADLISEKFYGGMRERANNMGLTFSAQSMKPFIDNLYALGQSDILYANSSFAAIEPSENRKNQEFAYLTAKMTASAGSIYDKPVRSESFTARPEANRWLNHPMYYKSLADIDFAAGVTKVTHHLFTHQPWTNLAPGMTLGYWGLHFERTQTWWHEINDWNQYLTRTQSMLSEGQPVFDILHLLGDDSSTKFDTHFVETQLPQGYDFEFISTHGLLNKLAVNDKKHLSYPNGRKYRILSLADDISMQPETLRKIRELLAGGATIAGRPPEFSPSLKGGALADEEVKRLADEIWGDDFKQQVFENIQDALAALNISPDLQVSGSDNKIVWRHHLIEQDNTDFYFISNTDLKKADISATFRASAKVVELWRPMTGERHLLENFTQKNGKTTIGLQLEQGESLFVVFTEAPTSNTLVNTKPYQYYQSIESPWTLDFIKGAHKPQSLILPVLLDLKDHSNDNVQYFSGTARYESEFSVKADDTMEYIIDLGSVVQFARVFINGQDLGLKMWGPYRYDITDALKTGNNKVLVEVTNLWPNRLIGDERQYPENAKWIKNGYQGYQLKDFPQWLKASDATSPNQRAAFTTWKHWKKEDDLQSSGLIGPVQILQRSKSHEE
ncbi:glycosyl hydrolase [Glaciecola sp. SC05]|uniref:glycosyl hydrolase n=1 Tax=Glaciecola sp. SC05 TaxID=1987355 RepID=UPI0035294032